MTSTATIDGARFVAPPATCGDEMERIAWAGTLAVRVDGDLHVGVRCTSHEILELLQDVLGDRAATDVPAPAVYSVRMGTGGRRRPPLHHLTTGSEPLLATRDVVRLLRALGNHLSAHVQQSSALHRVVAVPVLTPRGVLLAPYELMAMTRPLERVLVPAGCAMADVPSVLLDPHGPTVVVPVPALQLGVPAERAAGVGHVGVSEPVLPPGAYPLAGWLLAVGADRAGPLRTLDAAALMAHLVPPPYPGSGQEALDDLLAVVARTSPTGVTWATSDELVEQVVAAGRL